MHEKEVLMKEMPVWRMIPQLAIPTVIITLVMVIYNMADIFFIGQTGNSNMVNAVSLCMPVFTIVQALGTLIGAGGCTAIAIALGKKDTEAPPRISSFCCWFSVILGIVVAVFCNIFADPIVRLLGASDGYAAYAETYLRIISIGSAVMIFSNVFVNIIRADGSAKESMIANLTGTFVNIILDPVFILGFKWGIAGAAVATVVGNLVAMLMILRHVKKNSGQLSLDIEKFKFNGENFKILFLGLPLAAGTLLMSISYMLMNNILGTYGDDATGAFGIARSVMMLSTLTQMGIGMGMQPAMSYNYGDGNMKRVKEILVKTGIVTFTLGIAVTAVCILFRDSLLHAFIDSDGIYQYAEGLLIGCLATSAISGIFQLCSSFLQATNKPSWGTIVTVARHGVIFPLGIIGLNAAFGFNGLTLAIPLADVFAALLGVVLSVYWIKKTEDRKCK